MTIETEVALLTTATTNLLNAVNVSKATLDTSTAASATSAASSAASASFAGTSASSAGSAAASASISAGEAAASAALAAAVVHGDSVATKEFLLTAHSDSLPNLSFVDTCLWLSKDDTDGGAWRKKGQGKSWYSEARSAGKYLGEYATLASAVAAGGVAGDYYYWTGGSAFAEIDSPSTQHYTYRAGSADFPADAMVTAEATRVIIWDITSGTASMWMVFTGGYQKILHAAVSYPITSMVALNSTLVVSKGGTGFGIDIINFVRDRGHTAHPAATFNTGDTTVDIAGRHTNALRMANPYLIVDNAANDVAITVLPDAPLDEYGMPVPTIACATDSGVSVVQQDGTVVNSLAGIYNDITVVGTTIQFSRQGFGTIFYGNLLDLVGGFGTVKAVTTVSLPMTVMPLKAAIADQVTTQSGYGVQHAVAVGITAVVDNPSSYVKSLHANITSTYNTGYMPGDIRGCWCADGVTDTVTGVGAVADRSVKNVPLDVVGTLTRTAAAGGRSIYSGFSAANYLQQASNANWNALGTGDFSIIMSGVKWGTAGSLRVLVSAGTAASEGSWYLVLGDVTSTLTLAIANNVGTDINVAVSTATFTDTAEHTVEIKRYTQNGVASTVAILVDGVIVASAVSTLTVSNATGFLRIGSGRTAGVSTWIGGQVACVRISATAPTAEQSKFIAAQENALNGGQPCLLSNSSNVSALAYDQDTDILRVGNGTNVDDFQGLKRVASVAHGTTTLTALAAGNGLKATVGTAGGTFEAPQISVRSELLRGQLDLAKANQKPVAYAFTSSGTTQKLPQGFKAVGTLMNTTDGTFATPTQIFDGFIWTLSSLTTAKVYNVLIERA